MGNLKLIRFATSARLRNDLSSSRVGAFLVCVLILLAGSAHGAKYAGEAFNLGAGARPLALGGAYIALVEDATAIYYNPAGLSELRQRQVTLLHSETFGSLLNHDFVGYAQPTRIGARSGAVGIGIYRLGGGGIKLTEWDFDRGRPVVVSEESHYDYQVTLGAGVKLSPELAFGTAAKVILRSAADNSAWGLGLDVGLQYRVSKSLRVGASLRDLTSTFLAYDNGTRESIYPSLRTGIALSQQLDQLTVTALFDGDILFESRDETAQLSLGGASVDTHTGLEIGYDNLLYFRGGADIGKLTLGVGVAFDRFRLDGAFLDHSDLDNSYRVSLNVNF